VGNRNEQSSCLPIKESWTQVCTGNFTIPVSISRERGGQLSELFWYQDRQDFTIHWMWEEEVGGKAKL
jgi:hypothetical protein